MEEELKSKSRDRDRSVSDAPPEWRRGVEDQGSGPGTEIDRVTISF